MNRAIVIGSFVGSPWLKDCIDSMPRDIPVIVVCEPNYECGKIGWVHRHTNLDEFLFLPDTTVAKKHEWIREAFERQGSVSVNNEPAPMGSFMGKYRRQILDITGVPHTPDKSSAVDAEAMWTRKYCASETTPVHVLFPDFQHGPTPAKLEHKHGRMNAVMENDHLIKWKGTWHGGLIGEAEARDRQLAGRI
jgi:hypothetical protein